MIIEQIYLQNFLSHEDSTVFFTGADLWLVCGENGAGKSALLDAVEFALYGEHRGGNQNHQLLIKQGRERAKVQVVLLLGQTRYRITRQLYLKKASTWTIEQQTNTGWSIEPLDSIRATRAWIEEKLPPHRLFRSAIFLRQNQAAHFLVGSASDRMSKFKELLELEAYTTLSKRARSRADQAREHKHRLEALIAEAGDTSEQAVSMLRNRLATQQMLTAQLSIAATQASALLMGARDWHRLSRENAEQKARLESAQKLMAEEKVIEEAHALVSDWTRAEPLVERFWRAQKLSTEKQADTLKYREQLAKANKEHAAASGQRDKLIQRMQQLEALLPEARRHTEEEQNRLSALALEAKIAKEATKLSTAQKEVAALVGKEQTLLGWTQRKEALSVVGAFLRADQLLLNARKALQDAKESQQLEAQKSFTLQEELTNALQERNAAASLVEELSHRREELSSEISQLSGSLGAHAKLKGSEPECPTCAQPLSEAAHQHVRQRLSQEQEHLERLNKEKKTLEKSLSSAKKSQSQKESLYEKAQQALSTQQTQVATLLERAQQAERTLQGCLTDQQRALAPVESSVYAGSLSLLSDEWISREEAIVLEGVHTAKEDEKALRRAEQRLLAAQSALEALRGQRSPTAQPLGDSLRVEQITEMADPKPLEKSKKQIVLLEKELKEGQAAVLVLSDEVSRLSNEATNATSRAEESLQAAEAHLQEALQLKGFLAPSWEWAVSSWEGFLAAKERIDGQRPLAARLQELTLAKGRIGSMEASLADIQQKQEEIPQEHRIEVGVAQEAEQQARTKERDALRLEAELKQSLEELLKKKEQREENREQLKETISQEDLYLSLSEMLGDNGEIQLEIARQEQQRIVSGVNLVLKKMGDSISVSLGDARRAGGTKLQDVLFLDTGDPTGASRYFDFLSGGEQFRVALALALALHRRVGRGEVGTLIIDEGFGALDENRRDTLAQQMTDTSTGLLSLGLAKSIIICSHSNEVLRHFNNRWQVMKTAGVATVTCSRVVE